eukprot:m.14586 g.14586  ORF g.14586 m.14586 type:complete len:286 (+) comp10213_c0_seq1:216-1073(+)
MSDTQPHWLLGKPEGWRPTTARCKPPKLALRYGSEALLTALRRPTVLDYDASKYDFAAVIRACLDVDATTDLSELDGGDQDKSAKRGGHRGGGTQWIRQFKATMRDANVAAPLINVYKRFLREVVMPHIQAVGKQYAEDELLADGLYVQRVPSFRCHVPSTTPTGYRHCDADYGHQEYEMNVWVPVSKAFGNNSLWCESEPGKGDFTSFDLNVGQAQLFWGCRCHHFTNANDTHATRVSLDFRVTPVKLYVPEPPRDDGKPPRFVPGGFFDTVKMDDTSGQKEKE